MALIIVMVNSISMGSSLAFSTTAAVVYSSPNTTTLNEVLDEEQTSWLSNLALYYRKWKLTIWHHKKEIPDYLEEMEE